MDKKFITIGSFDGVHQGHKRLLGALKYLADLHSMAPLALYFPYPPRVLMGGDARMSVITLPSEKAQLLSALKVQHEPLDFEKLHNYGAQQFFDVLVKKYNMGGFLAGPDFAFGKDRQGHLEFLRKACELNDIMFVQAVFVHNEAGHKISSSLIRKVLKEGEIPAVNDMLGRPYMLKGKVIKGRQLGRTMGFPTANLAIDEAKLLPCGVFAGTAILGAETFKAVINIGYRPTVTHTDIPLTEVHILDFDRDIYGKELAVKFNFKIRGEVKFKGLDELKAQIKKDADAARLVNIK